jgi:hypothetical protein
LAIFKANAQLIGTAPELLEALEVAVTYMPKGHVLDGHFYPSQDRQKAFTAIAKARGYP